jgi:putative transposase
MNHRLADLCRALQVSAGGYHAWKARAPSARATADVALAAVIAATHHEFRERYGSRRLWRELRSRGIDCSRHRMDRLRREHGLWTRRRRRFLRARAALQRTPAAPRLCTWPFAASTPDRLWVGDMTVLPTREGPLYLAALVDACSRRVVGWAMDDHQRLDLTERALDMALQHRRPKPGLILHHDRGSQYTGARYRTKAETANIQLSMSRPGMPYDNAMAESFFATLKLELADDKPFQSREAARMAVFEYVELFYNRIRMHSALGYQSPVQVEREYQPVRSVP